MNSTLSALWRDECGLVVSAELVLVGTLAVMGMVAGISHVRGAVVEEYKELGDSLRSLNQSYSYSGFHGCKSYTAGSSYFQEGTEEVAFPDVYGDCPEVVVQPQLPAPQEFIVEEPVAPCNDCPQLPPIRSECTAPCEPTPCQTGCQQTRPCEPTPSCGSSAPCADPKPTCQPQPATPCEHAPAQLYRGGARGIGTYNHASSYGGVLKSNTGYNTLESVYNTRRYLDTPPQTTTPRSAVW